MAIEITVALDDIIDEVRELVLADRYRDAHALLREYTDLTLAGRYAVLREADHRPISYEPCGRGVRAVRSNV